jgi:hypothetical protein
MSKGYLLIDSLSHYLNIIFLKEDDFLAIFDDGYDYSSLEECYFTDESAKLTLKTNNNKLVSLIMPTREVIKWCDQYDI